MNRRGQLLVLSAIVLVGLLRGGWWVAVTEVLSPIDEVAHVDYVVQMGEHGRPPKVGRDRVDAELLEVAKVSVTSSWRPSPMTSDPDDPRWGAFAHSYEGVQPPLYYAVLAAPWKLLHGYGPIATVYLLRLATLAMALAALPFVWLLARELLPERPEVALGAPALLVLLGGFNANLASVGNDALVMTLATAALWLTARTWNRGYQAGGAVLVGALTGLAVLSKTTGLAVVPMVALGALGPLWTRGAVARRYIAWGFQAGGVAALVVAPWLLWNRATYGAWSASEAVDKITGPLQPPIPRTFDGMVTHLKSAVQAFWGAQLADIRIGHYAVYWTVAAAAILLAAAAVHLWRRRATRAALAIGWTALGVPLAILLMIGIIVGVFGGSSSVVGRHLYPGLPALAVALVASLVTVAGRRLALVALALLIAVGLTVERADVERYVRNTYTRGVEDGLTPVAGQNRGDAPVTGPLSIHLEADCDIRGVGIVFADKTAPVTVRTGATPVTPQPTLTRDHAGGGVLALYRVAPARAVDVDLGADATIAGGVRSAREDRLVPAALAYCAVANPSGQRFAALFHPQHPDWPFGLVMDWAKAWAVLGWIGFVATAGAVARTGLTRRAARDFLASEPRVARTAARLAGVVGLSSVSAKLQQLSTDLVSLAVPSYAIEGRKATVKLPGRVGRDQIATALRDGGWGGFEPPMPTVFAACAASFPGVIYDVGANTGFYSVIAAKVNHANRVHAFEPFPPVRADLHSTLRVNRCESQVRVEPVAVGGADGTAVLHVPVQDHGLVETSATLSADFKDEYSDRIDVAVVTLDAFRQHTDRVTVVKIDVESLEAEVLRGAAHILATDRPIIFCEVLPKGDAAAIDRIRRDANYVDVQLYPTRAVIGGTVEFVDDGWNHLLVPEEQIAAIRSLLRRCNLVAE